MEHWPASSLIDHVLFESFWPGLVLFGSLALVFGFRGLHTRNKRLGAAGGLLAFVAIALVPLSMMVQTTRERLIGQTRQLVDVAVPPLDRDGLSGLLDEPVQLVVVDDDAPAADGREQVLALAERAGRKYRVESWSISRVEARKLDADRAESFVRVNTALAERDGVAAGLGMGVQTEWLIEWRPDGPDAWRVARIKLLTIGNRPASRGQLP